MTTKHHFSWFAAKRGMQVGLLKASTGAVLSLLFAATVLGGIRVDGTDFQAGSARARIPATQKSLLPRRPTTLVFTFGQALMAQGSASGGAKPARIGLGYAYNHLYTSFCRCDCFADPKCDGPTDILDVVLAIGVAFRGAAAIHDTDCANRARTDVDCSGATDVLDVVKLINVAFRGAGKATQFCRPCP